MPQLKVTRKELVVLFEKLMRDNKGGIVDFPLRYIPDHELREALAPLRQEVKSITDDELLRGAQLAKGTSALCPRQRTLLYKCIPSDGCLKLSIYLTSVTKFPSPSLRPKRSLSPSSAPQHFGRSRKIYSRP